MLEPTFTIRPPAWDDFDPVLALIRACEQVDEGEPESMADDLRTDWRLPGVDLSRDAWVAVSPNGELAGYASVWQRVPGERFESDGYTHPDFRRRGIGTALLRALEARARELAKPGALLRQAVNHANEAARRLLEQESFSPARLYWRMVIDLESPSRGPEWPAQVSLRPFDIVRDEREIHMLIQQAFADNYDYSPFPFEAWRTVTSGRDDFDPTLMLVAGNASEAVGVARCLQYKGLGWVGTLAVRRDWRRRGIAMGLLRAAFAEFYRRGERRVGLTVDSFNRTGAKELYEHAGMRVERQHDGYEKNVGDRS